MVAYKTSYNTIKHPFYKNPTIYKKTLQTHIINSIKK